MNFTREIKREIMRREPAEKISFLAGILDTCGDREKLLFSIENEEIAAYVLGLFEAVSLPMTLMRAERDPKLGRDKLTFSHAGGGALFSVQEDEVSGRSYLAGAFLGSGSCTLPGEGKKTGYHLEIVFEKGEAAEAFLDLLDTFQLMGSSVRRGEKHVVYLKNREGIADFLSALGAERALSRLEALSAEREENNLENRVSNCYQGNADKSAIASAAQTVRLTKLKEGGVLVTLPEGLRTAAEARLAHPELSLSELAEKLGISKSCLNHRLRKLMALAGDRKRHD